MENHIRAIERIEDEVASTILANHARELAVVDDALNQIIIGFNDFSSRKGKPDNPLESARIFLAIRSFNSLRTARQTLERGYYQQAMTLVRMAMEDQLVAEDAETHTPTLDALLVMLYWTAKAKSAEAISPCPRWQREYRLRPKRRGIATTALPANTRRTLGKGVCEGSSQLARRDK